MNRQEPPVTITNPTGYPPTETFREGIVASAANLARYWAGRGLRRELRELWKQFEEETCGAQESISNEIQGGAVVGCQISHDAVPARRNAGKVSTGRPFNFTTLFVGAGEPGGGVSGAARPVKTKTLTQTELPNNRHQRRLAERTARLQRKEMEVVIAVVPTEGDAFTFYTVKGALTLAMAETGDARMFSMMGIPCADAEQAEAMVQWFSARGEALQ